MAATSLTLGPHWEKFVKREVASGRYASASEVIRDALRELEERGKRLEALRAHLDEGAKQAKRGEFAELNVDDIVARAKKRAKR
jgi:antitoxin ParD1/3/4